MGPKMSVIFVPYSREFVITVIVITKFDCTLSKILKYDLIQAGKPFVLSTFQQKWM